MIPKEDSGEIFSSKYFQLYIFDQFIILFSSVLQSEFILFSLKIHIFRKGHKILRNLPQLFVVCTRTASQIISGDFAKFCGLLRIYELYKLQEEINVSVNPRYDAIFFGNPG